MAPINTIQDFFHFFENLSWNYAHYGPGGWFQERHGRHLWKGLFKEIKDCWQNRSDYE